MRSVPPSAHAFELLILLVMVLGEVMEPLGGGALMDSTGVGFEALSLARLCFSPFALFIVEDTMSQLPAPGCQSLPSYLSGTVCQNKLFHKLLWVLVFCPSKKSNKRTCQCRKKKMGKGKEGGGSREKATSTKINQVIQRHKLGCAVEIRLHSRRKKSTLVSSDGRVAELM